MTFRSLMKLACAVLLAGLLPIQAQAATFTVTKAADTNDGSCDADCSLREAIVAANASGGSDTVSIPAGTYNLSIAGTGEDAAATGDLDISDTLTISGAGAASTIIDGNSIDRVFHVLVGPTVTISDVTIRDGDAGGDDGGGIWNESNITLNNVTMSNNSAADGGAIFSQRNPNSLTLSNVTLNGNSASARGGAIGIQDDNASLSFTDVTMSGNSAVAEGGAFFGERVSGTMTRVVVTGNTSQDGAGLAIFNGASNITLTDVTVSSNTASRRGGGILVDAATTTFSRVTVDANSCTSERGGGLHFRGGGLANLTNVTVSGNTCDEGGGINVEGGHIVNLTNVTLNANGAPSGGGGLWRSGGTLTILNTIVANSASGGDCTGTIIDGGNNLDTDGTCLVTLTAPPLLGALQFNGGLTRTHALLTSSPAIDTGTNSGCPATDQRGVARPINGTCDIGAYEGFSVSTVISGNVLEDINGDAGLGDAVGVGNVRVRLYEDVNDNGVVDTGDLYSADTLTAGVTGAYSFSVSTGTNFLVAVDSKTVTPSGGFNIGSVQSEVWAEQTYGDNPVTAALDPGPRVGGRNSTTPDDVDPVMTLPADNEYQHLARVDVSGGNVTGVDFAFSFNVISNTLDGADVDTLNPRTRQGTLRQFVQNANAILNPNTVDVPAGTYNLNIAGTGEDAATTGDLDISDTLTINGASAASTIIDGNSIDRVFHVLVGPTVTISDVTIRDGDAGGDDGGGIWNESNITLNNVTMSNNSAADGGAIFSGQNPNSLTLSNVTLTGNSATNNGGAIGMKDDNASLTFLDVTMTGNTAAKIGGGFYGEKASGTMTRVTATGNDSEDGAGLAIFNGASNITLTDVTVSSNTASRRGGGILVDAATTTFSRVTVDANSCTSERGGGLHFRGGGLANLTNVTVSGNTCDEGGGINVEGGHIVNLINVTLNANGAPSGGGGLWRSGGTLTILNTIVANSTTGGNCSGTIVSSGTNLDSANTCLLTGPGDLINSDPDLGPLQNNGGLTETHALGSASAAIDTGDNTNCPATDQRGVARPIDGDVDAIAVCDIGAYEAPPAISAALELTMADSVDPVSIGSAFEYALTVTNNGADDASNVTLVDTLPADVDWQSATPSQGSCVHSGEALGGTVTCTLDTIANGANATVTIGVVAPNTTGVINNSATVSADEPDPDASDNTAAEDTTIIDPSANLRVTQVEDYDPAGVNLPFVYTVTVTNQGPADATLVTLTDTLDAAVTYQSAVPSQGSCAEAAGVVTCDLGGLANGSIATVDITVTAPATPQTVTNTAVVSAAEPDSDSADNTSAEDTGVVDPQPADLALTQTADPQPVVAENPLTYVLTVNNLGPGPATLVELTDTLPAGITYQSATPSSGSCSESGGIVTCDLGAIASGGSETVTIVVTAPSIAGVITNTASVSTARVDSNAANDSASADTTVIVPGEADLALSQADSPDPVLVNQTLSYSVLVDNQGPDDATAVVMIDTLPTTVAFQSVVTGQGSCAHSGEPLGGTVTCALGTIANGDDASIEIIVTAPSDGGTITNNASVSASSDDLNVTNDTSSETTTVQNLNVNQLCYLVADAGGANGGNDLLTQIDTADFNPATNETNIGTGTGTNTIEAIAWNSATGVLYAADAGQLGTLSTTTGVFTALPSPFGTGGGALGNISFTDVDGLAYDATTGILYGVERQTGSDVLIQINMATGGHVPNAFGAGVDYVPMPPISGNNLTDDIAVDPTTGVMYASVNSGGSSDRLIRVNKTTGATTDVALITVPDIEGLGTDPSGQLWGTSGTQNILYEINKTTGTGSNGRPIDNGSDYESVDCYAFSPTVSADLGVSKTVDDPAPPEGDTVTYTVTVTNAGPSTATVVQLSDVLPAGVTFVSASPVQGTYDGATGDWFVGTVAVGGSATLTLQASVDAATVGTTITNTASVTYLSQNDPNAGNSSASVDITPVAANLTVIKSVATIRDPLGATTPAALAIPGAVVEYEISISNSGNGPATEVIVTDTLDENLTFLAGDFDGGAADVQISVGAAAPVYCIAEVASDANADGCFLNATGDFLTVTIPVSATYPTGLTVGTAAPDNVAVVHFRATVN